MIGQQISHYHILEKLGEGGMGVVYKARDTRLERFVALKVLSARAVSSPDRRQRFIQEAKSASALNHPNIITVYDIETAGDTVFIVMEYVEGRTLDRLIHHKGLPLGEALRYAVQIADALATAHEAGIVHRDIKPANIMVTPKGLVKVLDFGLAKLVERGYSSSDGEPGPTTLTIGQPIETDEGVILGTVAYMSPEQAQDKKLDGRSDIFSFGALLYEMTTGQRAFRGENKMSTLAAIINQEPMPVGRLVAGLPREVERIIGLCLRKDPARRYQHMEDLKVGLEELKDESDSGRLVTQETVRLSVPKPRPRRSTIVALALILLAAIAAGTWLLRQASWKRAGQTPAGEGAGGGRLTLLASAEGALSDPTLSPDGKMIAYTAEEQGQADLFVARVAGGSRVRLTNDEARETAPQFSPDGERIAYTRSGANRLPEVWIIPALGGQASRVMANAMDPCWSPDGSRLAFVLRPAGESDTLATAAVDGTDLRKILGADGAYPFLHNPAWSPDGSRLIVARSSGGVSSDLWLVPLSGGAPRRISNDAPGVFSSQPVFTPGGRGVVHQSNRAGATNLWLLRLDGDRLVRLTAGPGPDESPSVARDGSITFVNTRIRCVLLAQNLATGQVRELQAHSSYLWAPAFSPDGRELAYSQNERDGAWHVWIAPLPGGAPRRLTSGALPEVYPRFTPDGAWIVYHTWSPGPDRIWRVPRAGGPPQPLTPARDDDDAYADVSPDGRWLAFARTEKEQTRIYIAPLSGGAARRLIDAESTLPRWSPDGRWIAFSPNRRNYASGVFVVGADGSGLRRVSETGGWPVWWPDGKRIGYQELSPGGSEQIASVASGGGSRQLLGGIRLNGTNHPFDISRDGRWLATSNCTDVSSEIWLLSGEGRRD